MQFKQQLNQELEQLQGSYQALKMAQMKYKECRTNVKQIGDSADEQIMVPLTASLYVPGKVSNSDKFLIDVGTGYYVEKTGDEAANFFDSRLTKLSKDSTKLSSLIGEKAQLSQRVDEVLRQKLAKQQAELGKK